MLFIAASFAYCSFLVESMDISHGDVRIKDTDSAGTSDKARFSTSQKSDSSSASKSIAEKAKKDSKKSGGSYISPQKRKNFSRSQSVTTPKLIAPKPETTFSYSRQSSFSTMSDADLESWKLNTDSMHSSRTSQQEEPMLTVASSLTDSSNVTVGFDVKEEEKK